MSKKQSGDGAEDIVPEVLPPESENSTPAEASKILALISNYTDRPDLLIAEIEKHDPGFVKRMNASAERHSSDLRKGKYRFGKIQAYTALAVSVFAALACLGLLAYAVYSGAGFWTLIALIIFYSVSQSGTKGFSGIVQSCQKLIESFRGRGDD